MRKKRHSLKLLGLIVLCQLLFNLCCIAQASAQTTFSFKLTSNCHTSAGVFNMDGTLVRTLWSDKVYNAGNFTETWDNKDDQGKPLPNSTYQFRVLTHNVKYSWDGSIGNTSDAVSGPTVIQGYRPIRDMIINDTALFYITGYTEHAYNMHWLKLSDLGSQKNMGRVDTYTAISLFCTDGQRMYIANNDGGYHAGGNVAFVYAMNMSDHSEYKFPEGSEFTVDPSVKKYNVIDLGKSGPLVQGFPKEYSFIQSGASGLAVQRNGQILAIAHYTQNEIRLFDKTSGKLLNRIPAEKVTSLSMSESGDLWAVVNGEVLRYTNLSKTPVVSSQIKGLQDPLIVAADPGNDDLILIADGGKSQQIKAFSKSGVSLWVLGEEGGYDVNGNAMSNSKFKFRHNLLGKTSFITILKDHSFWFGDIGNNRSLHYSSSRNFIGQITFQPAIYSCSVDQNDPTRVFYAYHEFKVDYTKPIKQSWALVRNWSAGLDSKYTGDYSGVRQVTTLSNGRTYGLVMNSERKNLELVELTGKQLRTTGIFPAADFNQQRPTLNADGSVSLAPIRAAADGAVTWYKRKLARFDSSDNPVWSDPEVLASASASRTDPIPRYGSFGDIKAPVTSSGILVSFDQTKSTGWHLGGIKVGDHKWLWKTSPTGSIDGKGTFDIGSGVHYAGNTVMSSGRNIIYGYHGELWKNAEANQFMHFYDDGLFVSQFGNSSVGHTFTQGALKGFAGNGFSPCLVVAGGETYMWVNDESSNGPQRWHITGLQTIKEITGSGKLNSNLTLASLADSSKANLGKNTVPAAIPKNTKAQTASAQGIQTPLKSANQNTSTSANTEAASNSSKEDEKPSAPTSKTKLSPIDSLKTATDVLSQKISSNPITDGSTLAGISSDSSPPVSQGNSSVSNASDTSPPGIYTSNTSAAATPSSTSPASVPNSLETASQSNLISDSLTANKLVAYPNPNRDGRLTVVLPSYWKPAVLYYLIDMQGRVLTKGRQTTFSGLLNLDFSSLKLVSSVYFVVVQSGRLIAQCTILKI